MAPRHHSIMLTVFCLLFCLYGTSVQASIEKRNADPEANRFSAIATLAGLGSSANTNPACGPQDALTNLLLYQYLLGDGPGGGIAPPGAPAIGGINSLRALLAVEGTTTTATSISTSLTTVLVTADPTTEYSTSTTSYVTTVTSIDTKVIPVLFRGSRITTEIEETTSEVITATEYMTSSWVSTPTIVQTLPVHITITATKTQGLDGKFTVIDEVPGPSSVVHQPVATATYNLDSLGLDIGNLDLSQLDLTSLTNGGRSAGGKDDQMLDVLSSLLQQYSEGSGGASKKTTSQSVSTSFRTSQSNSGQSRGGGGGGGGGGGNIHDESFIDNNGRNDELVYSDGFEDDRKFNVLKGFTLADHVAELGAAKPAPRPPPRNNPPPQESPRFRVSKYHTRNVKNNNLNEQEAENESEREAERFAASTSRRTFSRSNGRGRSLANNRNVRRPNRMTPRNAQSRRTRFEEAYRERRSRFSRSEDPQEYFEEEPEIVEPKPDPRNANRLRPFGARLFPKIDDTPYTKVLTMYVSGTSPGHYYQTYRTVTYSNVYPNRLKRDISPTHAVPSPTLLVSQTAHLPEEFVPKKSEIVRLLKKLDTSKVKETFVSLHKYIDEYETEIIYKMEAPELSPSPSASPTFHPEATPTVAATPSLFSSTAPEATPMFSDCPSLSSIVTETIYQTIFVTSVR